MLTLRHYMVEDIPTVHRELGCNPDMLTYTGWNPYATVEQTAEMVAHFMEGYATFQGDYSFIIDVDGTPVGTVAAYDYDEVAGSMEIGYSIFQPFWGHGYATEAVKQLVDFLAAQGLHSLTAWTASENAASAKVLTNNGFTQTEVHPNALEVGDRTFDQVFYQRILKK